MAVLMVLTLHQEGYELITRVSRNKKLLKAYRYAGTERLEQAVMRAEIL